MEGSSGLCAQISVFIVLYEKREDEKPSTVGKKYSENHTPTTHVQTQIWGKKVPETDHTLGNSYLSLRFDTCLFGN